MKLLNKILCLFKPSEASKPIQDCQVQSKTTFHESGNIQRNKIKPVNNVSVGFEVSIVGVSFYQKVLEQICGDRYEESVEMLLQAKIIPYDENPYDAYKGRPRGHPILFLSRGKVKNI